MGNQFVGGRADRYRTRSGSDFRAAEANTLFALLPSAYLNDLLRWKAGQWNRAPAARSYRKFRTVGVELDEQITTQLLTGHERPADVTIFMKAS